MDKDENRFMKIKEHHKKTFEKALSQGKIDFQMQELCEFISKTRNYFTSSHCSGRIMLLKSGMEEEKKEGAFYRKWHRKIKFKELIEAINSTQENLWLKMDAFILHIGCRTIKGAEKLLELKDKSGIKRGGIIVLQEGKILFEFLGTQKMSLPVKQGKKLLVSEKYIKTIAEIANKKLEKNFMQIERMAKNAEKMLK
ncbi:MAG: hypothetical protein ABIA76_03265 [Candidatus Diapherotrites archaeon]